MPISFEVAKTTRNEGRKLQDQRQQTKSPDRRRGLISQQDSIVVALQLLVHRPWRMMVVDGDVLQSCPATNTSFPSVQTPSKTINPK
jgi:hypothetical protein